MGIKSRLEKNIAENRSKYYRRRSLFIEQLQEIARIQYQVTSPLYHLPVELSREIARYVGADIEPNPEHLKETIDVVFASMESKARGNFTWQLFKNEKQIFKARNTVDLPITDERTITEYKP